MIHSPSTCLRRFRQDQSGAVAVEFVLIAPILFALLFGILVLGYLFAVSHSVAQLASGAARASVYGLDAAERREIAQTYLSQAPQRYPLLDATALSTAIVMEDAPVAGVTVSVSYNADASVLGLANGLLGLGITDVEGSAYLAY